MARRVLPIAAWSIMLALQLIWPIDMTGRHTDLASFLAAGRLARAGENPYALTPDLWYVDLRQFGIVAPTVNLNPPVSVLALELLAGGDLPTLFRAALLVHAALYGLALLVLIRAFPDRDTRWLVPWSICLTGVWQTLSLGQIYFWLLLPVIGSWLALRARRFVLAGLALGVLIAIKPNFAIWPLLLACAGSWPTALVAIAGAAALSLVPLARYGPQIYAQWLAALPVSEELMAIPGNNALTGSIARLGLPPLVGSVLGGALVLLLAAWAWRRRPDPLTVSALALIATLLVGPLSWTGYTILLLPVLWECQRPRA